MSDPMFDPIQYARDQIDFWRRGSGFRPLYLREWWLLKDPRYMSDEEKEYLVTTEEPDMSLWDLK